MSEVGQAEWTKTAVHRNRLGQLHLDDQGDRHQAIGRTLGASLNPSLVSEGNRETRHVSRRRWRC